MSTNGNGHNYCHKNNILINKSGLSTINLGWVHWIFGMMHYSQYEFTTAPSLIGGLTECSVQVDYLLDMIKDKTNPALQHVQTMFRCYKPSKPFLKILSAQYKRLFTRIFDKPLLQMPMTFFRFADDEV